MARIDVKKAILLGGIVALFFLLGGATAHFIFSSQEADLFMGSTFKNPVGPPSIKGPSGPPPMPNPLPR